MQAHPTATQPTFGDRRAGGRPADAPVGYLLAALCLLAFVALLHHPVSQGSAPQDLLASIRAQAGTDRLVHATLGITFALLTTAMSVVAIRLGLHRVTVIGGLIAYAGAALLMLLATMTDGFVVPAIAGQCAPNAACATTALNLIMLSSIEIEMLSRYALFGIAAAVVAWSAALLSSKTFPRWAGFIGLAAGIGQLAILFGTGGQLTPSSLLPLFGGQVVWYLLCAGLMIFDTRES